MTVPHKYDSGNLLVCDGKKVVFKSLHRNCAALFDPGIRVRLFNEATNRLWWILGPARIMKEKQTDSYYK